ncbi:hypothetical protein LC612_31705 [Nostoc sp. CHAB 5834]|nr:hypothetical protein [Nostoc sp. CHAB 5834]
MKKVIVHLGKTGEITVLTDSPDVLVIVLDSDVDGTDGRLRLGGQEYAVDSLLDGLPKAEAVLVDALCREIGPALVDPSAMRSTLVTGSDRVQLANLSKALRS